MKIAILGTSPGSLWDAPLTNPDVQCWTMPSFYRMYEKLASSIDCWFEFHPDPERFRDGWLGWAIENQPKCYLQEPHSELKNSEAYPLERITAHFGRYFTSSASLMVAAAVDAGASEIQVFGIDMITSSEYVRQRPCFEYIVGVARGMGVKVDIADGSPVLQCKWIYGYERPPGGWSSPFKLVSINGQGLAESVGVSIQ